MNFLKKGPELKLSALKDIKVPGFVEDVYYDLKERHLLPIAVILLVALVAVPIALSQSSSEAEEAGGEAGASTSVSGAEARSGELVSKAAPGLRDYRRRLQHLRAKDPFIQQYTGSGSSASESSSESTGSVGTEESSSTESSTPESSYTPTESSSGGEGGEPNQSRLRYYSYAIDVRVTAGGSQEAKKETEPTVRRNLPELTMLPSRETPALVYMGSTKDGKKALFVVSSDVDSIFGDAKCVLGSTTCQMLAMETGLPETVVYGSGKTYKIELLKIHLVETKDLNRAPLGKPKSKDSEGEPAPHPHGQRLAIGEEAQMPGR